MDNETTLLMFSTVFEFPIFRGLLENAGVEYFCNDNVEESISTTNELKIYVNKNDYSYAKNIIDKYLQDRRISNIEPERKNENNTFSKLIREDFFESYFKSNKLWKFIAKLISILIIISLFIIFSEYIFDPFQEDVIHWKYEIFSSEPLVKNLEYSGFKQNITSSKGKFAIIQEFANSYNYFLNGMLLIEIKSSEGAINFTKDISHIKFNHDFLYGNQPKDEYFYRTKNYYFFIYPSNIEFMNSDPYIIGDYIFIDALSDQDILNESGNVYNFIQFESLKETNVENIIVNYNDKLITPIIRIYR